MTRGELTGMEKRQERFNRNGKETGEEFSGVVKMTGGKMS